MTIHPDQNPNYQPTTRHPLTLIRVLRGLICLVVLLSTAFTMLVYGGFITAVMLRFFSIRYSRKGTSFCFGAWIALWPFLFEKINRTKVIFSGASVPPRERALLIANHRTEVDWMYLWDLALRKGCQGYIKYVLKSSLMKLPVFGWAFHILEFVSVERKWEVDRLSMHNMLSTFKDPQDALWLVLFPEGTDFAEHKRVRSQKYATEHNLPILENVLLPKTKGFCACLDDLRDTLDAVYDITIAYKHQSPTFMDNVYGVNPSEVHIHIRRIPINDIPISENEASAWLMDTFTIKDKLLFEFYAKGQFSSQATEGDLTTMKCVVHCAVLILLTVVCMTLTFSSSIWFKMYVCLACAYLTSATYFNFRPVPVFGILKEFFAAVLFKD